MDSSKNGRSIIQFKKGFKGKKASLPELRIDVFSSDLKEMP